MGQILEIQTQGCIAARNKSRTLWESPFTGTFDGNGKLIYNFTFRAENMSHVGIFRYIQGRSAEIRDVGLVDPCIVISGSDALKSGPLAGSLSMDSQINGCFARNVYIRGYGKVGGLVGDNSGGVINYCYVTGRVRGTNTVGGLMGSTGSGPVIDCYAEVDVWGRDYVGGLTGINCWAYIGGCIERCYAKGTVRGRNRVGGLIGSHWSAKVNDSYAQVEVQGETWVGGLAGEYIPGYIINCYSTGYVQGNSRVGGLIGSQGLQGENGQIFFSYWDTQTSGQTTSGGGTGLSTEEMKEPLPYSEWFCDPANWKIQQGADYPRLIREDLSGEPMDDITLLLEGEGTSVSPFLITSEAELNCIGNFPAFWDKHFKLMSDLDMGDYSGESFNSIGSDPPFSGVFDGNGHVIYNFTYEDRHGDGGFFMKVEGEGAKIQKLGLVDPYIDLSVSQVGGLANLLVEGTISECYVEGGDISGHYEVGGLVGKNTGVIINCYSYGGLVSGDRYVGGLVGHNTCLITSPCATIRNCYSTRFVEGESKPGGLVGLSEYCAVETQNSFWDVQASGQSKSDGGKGLSSEEMKQRHTYVRWAEQPVWVINDGLDYPRLVWQGTPGDPILAYHIEINRGVVIPGTFGNQGTFLIYGFMPECPAAFQGGAVEIVFGPYAESLRYLYNQGSLVLYRGNLGGITLFMMNLPQKTFLMLGQNVNLGGLRTGTELNLGFDYYLGSGQYTEPIPLFFLRGVEDTLTVNSLIQAGTMTIVRGTISVDEFNINLNDFDMTIWWGETGEIIPAGSWYSAGNMFIYRKPFSGTGKIYMALFDLGRCTFSLTILEAVDDYDFNISFSHFSESAEF